MQWVRRGLWIAAWGVWIGLGFGLAHYLPKRATIVCRLDLAPEERPLCFLNGGADFATVTEGSENSPSVVHVWDVASGRLSRTVEGPLAGVSTPRSWPFVVTSNQFRPHRPAADHNEDVAILDLRSGAWTTLPVRDTDFAVFHRRRPWCISRAGDDGASELTVIDLDAKRVLFRWRARDRAYGVASVGQPLFLGDDRVAIPVKRSPSLLQWREFQTLEIWWVTQSDRPPLVLEDLEVPYGAEASADGMRIAWSAFRERLDKRFEVFDVNLGRIIFPKDRPGPEEWVRHFGRRAAISSDGRSILNFGSNPGEDQLFDVDTEEVRWRAERNERAFITELESDRFLTFENWSFTLFGKEHELFNWVVRSLKDGSLLFRCWEAPFDPLQVPAAGGHFFVRKTNEIQLLPYRTDWRLLALCQSVLALPLILLWLALFWRRKRRERRLADGAAALAAAPIS